MAPTNKGLNVSRLLALGCAFITVTTATTWAQDARSIMAEADSRSISSSSAMKTRMTIFPEPGNPRNSREFQIQSYGQGKDDSYAEFIEPRSIRGLKILTLGDDIRVFFPSTGRTRRITGSGKSGSVGGVGGDFTYEDMGGGSYLESYTDFQLLDQDAGTWTIQGTPTDKDSSYTKVVFRISRENNLSLQTDYYTAKEGKLKTLTVKDIRLLAGRYIPFLSEMINHHKNQKTVIEISEARFDGPIDPKYFDPNRFYR